MTAVYIMEALLDEPDDLESYGGAKAFASRAPIPADYEPIEHGFYGKKLNGYRIEVKPQVGGHSGICVALSTPGKHRLNAWTWVDVRIVPWRALRWMLRKTEVATANKPVTGTTWFVPIKLPNIGKPGIMDVPSGNYFVDE